MNNLAITNRYERISMKGTVVPSLNISFRALSCWMIECYFDLSIREAFASFSRNSLMKSSFVKWKGPARSVTLDGLACNKELLPEWLSLRISTCKYVPFPILLHSTWRGNPRRCSIVCRRAVVADTCNSERVPPCRCPVSLRGCR